MCVTVCVRDSVCLERAWREWEMEGAGRGRGKEAGKGMWRERGGLGWKGELGRKRGREGEGGVWNGRGGKGEGVLDGKEGDWAGKGSWGGTHTH